MSVRSTVLQLVDGEKPWTWNEFAQGGLAWNKVRWSVNAKLNYPNLVYIACSTYQSINVLEKIGNKYIKWGLVLSLCGYTALCGRAIKKKETAQDDILWKGLRGMHMVGTVAEIIREFHQHPMKTVAFVGSMLIQDTTLERLTVQLSTVFALHQALLTKNGLFRATEWRDINATVTKICDATIALLLVRPMLANTERKLTEFREMVGV